MNTMAKERFSHATSPLLASLVEPNQEEAIREHIRPLLMAELGPLGQDYGTTTELISLNEPEAKTLDTVQYLTRICTSLHQLGDEVGILTLMRVLGVHTNHSVFADAIEQCLVNLTRQNSWNSVMLFQIRQLSPEFSSTDP